MRWSLAYMVMRLFAAAALSDRPVLRHTAWIICPSLARQPPGSAEIMATKVTSFGATPSPRIPLNNATASSPSIEITVVHEMTSRSSISSNSFRAQPGAPHL
uniref:Secreted protein n=1 Tax=Arundo donax TaxID=35708 RepID=A0A0A9DVV0_ARUDO